MLETVRSSFRIRVPCIKRQRIVFIVIFCYTKERKTTRNTGKKERQAAAAELDHLDISTPYRSPSCTVCVTAENVETKNKRHSPSTDRQRQLVRHI